jgi:hypothetical protein
LTAPWGAAVAGIFVWLGMVVAISFMEAPLKFHAPGVTLQIGLGIGRLVFRALNAAELVLAMAVLAGEEGQERSRGHYAYVGLELIKAIALLVSGILLLAA